MICITGSESFIGKVLQQQLASQNLEFWTVDTIPSIISKNHVQLDICSKDLTSALPEKADAIIHLAAISRDQDCRMDPVRAFQVNVNGTLRVMEAAKEKHIPQILFASSEWVYGDVGAGIVQKESDSLNPAKLYSEYALTKLVGEQLLRMESERGTLSATLLRFSIVYGHRPSNWSAVEQLFAKVKRGEAIEVGSLKTARRFIHVNDLCKGILVCVGRQGLEIFNLSGNEIVTLGDIIATSERILNQKVSITETKPSAISIRNPDNELIKKTVGWSPAISLEEGLQTLMQIQE